MRAGGVFFKIYSVFLALTAAIALAFYAYTLPWVREQLLEQERRANQVLLNNTVEVVRGYQRELESWREQMLEARKQLLRERVRSAARLVSSLAGSGRPREVLSREVVRLLASLGGPDDYIWVTDYAYRPVYHPYLQPSAGSGSMVDLLAHAERILPRLVDLARQEGEGFTQYRWPRRPGLPEEPKLSYVLDVPAWGWVMGSGVYLSDLEKAVATRRQRQLEDIRALLKATPIGGAGYIYVFDGQGRMVVHPDPALEGMDVSTLKDPATGKPLAAEIMAAARDGGVLEYQWNRPGDPDNYSYWKIAWVRYLPEADWYIATSVYRADLFAHADALIQRIVVMATAVMVILVLVAGILARRFSRPLEHMAEVATLIANGRLSERLEVSRHDEVGRFAAAFNRMVDRLHNALTALETEVEMQTRELRARVEELRQRTRDEALISRILTTVQQAEDEMQACEALARSIADWSPGSSGVIWIRHAGQEDYLRMAARWGHVEPGRQVLRLKECPAARLGGIHEQCGTAGQQVCGCPKQDEAGVSLCLPVSYDGVIRAVVELVFDENAVPDSLARKRLRGRLERIVRPLGMALHNLHLRQRLRDQSIRDGLTGLYNRRFLDDRLEAEIRRCERAGVPLAILLVDVDFFKHINDTWGHPAGDQVLIKLATLMQTSVRESDLVCRYGGEEFVLVLPDIQPDQAVERAEALRQRVENTAFVIDEAGTRLNLTLSVGVAWYPAMGCRGGQIIRAADIALYRAKRGGRNRVEVAEAVEDPEDRQPASGDHASLPLSSEQREAVLPPAGQDNGS
ncbi:diguanylate cyclase [Hahella sp. SMD15-11]|uniref:diguanylate cyclase n=1 Tax=Thermohahella caldifontis TaxID=3142973 RepID=A0AB39V0A7_9GAMM